MRGSTVLGWALVIVVGGALFALSYEVQELEAELDAVREQIVEDRERVHVLRAEWSYLNQPKRLRELAAEKLGLVPITPAQVMSWKEFERRRTR